MSKSNPFTCVGLDYLGPIQVEEDKCSKENVDRLSAKLFLECLRYFKPSLIVSDNAPQFRLVKSVTIYLMVITSEHLSYTCTYCWQPVMDCDYEQHISRICPEFLIECVSVWRVHCS